MKVNTEWAKLLQKAHADECKPIPTGFKSMREWLKEFEISETTWRRKVPLFESKEILTKGYYSVIENGRKIRKPFWRKGK